MKWSIEPGRSVLFTPLWREPQTKGSSSFMNPELGVRVRMGVWHNLGRPRHGKVLNQSGEKLSSRFPLPSPYGGLSLPKALARDPGMSVRRLGI